MGTFNAFYTKKYTPGANIPVWLGVVTPLPVGGVLASAFAKAGMYLPAGSPVELKSGILTPLATFEVTAVSTESTNSIITVKPSIAGYKLTTSDFVQVLGSTFAATGKAAAISAVADNATDATCQDITCTTANLDSVTVGKVIVISAATAAGTGKAIAVKPNGYLYNDIYIDADAENVAASGAVVNFHGEGILINRTASAIVKEQMIAAVPNVIQVEY